MRNTWMPRKGSPHARLINKESGSHHQSSKSQVSSMPQATSQINSERQLILEVRQLLVIGSRRIAAQLQDLQRPEGESEARMPGVQVYRLLLGG